MLAQSEKKSLKRNDAIQGLRAIAFVAIFISHAGLGNFSALGAWGVSVFFVMSGFLMMFNYIKKDRLPDFGFRFVWSKIKKLYPLHIFTMLLAARYALCISGDIAKIVLDMGIHTFLIQMWIPHTKYYSTLNGPSWYLCTSIFLYLCFPLILKFFKKHMTIKKAYAWLSILFTVQVIVSICAFVWGSNDNENWFSVKWLVYYAPPLRLIDFSIGCGLGYLALYAHGQDDSKKTKKPITIILEIIVCLLIGISVYIYTKEFGLLGKQAFKYSLLFIPTTVPLIWLVFTGKGFLSGILSIKPVVRLGDLSPYTFLIHGVVLRWVSLLMLLIFNIEITVLNACVSFVCTVVGAVLWTAMSKYVSKWFLKYKEKIIN